MCLLRCERRSGGNPLKNLPAFVLFKRVFEDRMLQRDLPGHADYATSVPGIWRDGGCQQTTTDLSLVAECPHHRLPIQAKQQAHGRLQEGRGGCPKEVIGRGFRA
jgi:hypothetical protein